MSFSGGFAGNKVVYLAARDVGSGNSGWQALGTWNVPGTTPPGPWVSGMTPGRSNASTGSYTFTFTDSNGWQDITVANILVNDAIDGRHACYLAFVPSGASAGSLFLVDDAGDAGGPYVGMPLPSGGTIFNSQCTISGANTTSGITGTSINGAGSWVSASGNTLTLTLAITFTQSFAGNQILYLAARNSNGQNSNWQAVGTVTIP